mgnify:CR=1 FL=1
MSPIVNLQLVVKCKKRSFNSFKVEVALLRYIVFYCELGCDTSEPHVSYISRTCSSLVRQPYYIPNRFILKISGLVVVLTVRKVHWAGRAFYMDEYTLIFLFSQCIRCAQKRYCWESVRFASERSRVRVSSGPPNIRNPNLRPREVKGSNPSRSIKSKRGCCTRPNKKDQSYLAKRLYNSGLLL